MKKMLTKFSILTSYLSLQSGQTLIETLAALAIISIVITAIGISTTAALSNAKYNQYVTQATKYAQQGAELITQQRDDDYNNFQKLDGIYCLKKDQTTISNPPQGSCTTPNIDNLFIRSVSIQQGVCDTNTVNVASVTVTVAFTDSKCQGGTYCHTQVVNSCLSTVNPVQVP
jgi:prepilin-type N-terminal cleavage/methylation domain-containing protein